MEAFIPEIRGMPQHPHEGSARQIAACSRVTTGVATRMGEVKRLRVTCVARNAAKANFLTTVSGNLTVRAPKQLTRPRLSCFSHLKTRPRPTTRPALTHATRRPHMRR